MLLEEIGPNQLQRTNSVGVVNGWKSSNLPYVGSTDSVPGSPRYPSYCIFFICYLINTSVYLPYEFES